MRFKYIISTALVISALSVSGCSMLPKGVSHRVDSTQIAPVVSSSLVGSNSTPYDKLLVCMGNKLEENSLSIAVGDIRDYTGKSSSDEGLAITQGGALMAYSALGKMGSAIEVHERFDTRIADAELNYIKNRQLGDGTVHEVPDAETGAPSEVPWKPYFGGSVLQSDYYIVGGITELNYNIRSQGIEGQINQVGPKRRQYVMNIAVDLRIVGTQSLKVYHTASVQKQLVGYEIGIDVFRFFGENLFDIYAGQKNQEPLQLGVRMAIEAAVIELIAAVSDTSADDCKDLLIKSQLDE